jgi:hypothetical protein
MMNDQFGTETKKNGMAITSMVMGIVGWVLALIGLCVNFVLVPAFTAVTVGWGAFLYICTCVPIAIPPIFWIIGLVTGYVGRNQINESGAAGMGMAKSGIIMAYVGLGLGLLSTCVIVILLITGASLPFLEGIPGLESFQY